MISPKGETFLNDFIFVITISSTFSFVQRIIFCKNVKIIKILFKKLRMMKEPGNTVGFSYGKSIITIKDKYNKFHNNRII